MVVDTACSSSLVAASLACSSLKDCSQAVMVGENLLLDPITTVRSCQTRMMAADGQCKTSDAAANGYVRSEGCVVLALRAATNELQQATLLGYSVNQDGEAANACFTAE